jgi:hypothetical protein
LRNLQDHGLAEVPSTRLLVATARLIKAGIAKRDACYFGLVAPLTDDASLISAMRDPVKRRSSSRSSSTASSKYITTWKLNEPGC